MSVASVYRYVIDDVIKNMKNEFINEGVSEQVLMELQAAWETRLLQAGAIPTWGGEHEATYERYYDHTAVAAQMPGYPSYVGDTYPQQMPYTTNTLATGGYGAAPPTLAQPRFSQIPTALPPLHSLSTMTSDYDNPTNVGRPQQYMPPSQWQREQEQNLNIKLAPTQNKSSRGPHIPQHDGSLDGSPSTQEIDAMIEARIRERRAAAIPQFDGGDDKRKLDKQRQHADDAEAEGDGDDGDGDGEGDEELHSDLDDPDDEEPDTEHIVLCQFEKVTRIKNKRKTNLKDGIMHLNGRDYLFHKANGEFDW
jgi:transcription initiation factor TFIIA large subunit